MKLVGLRYDYNDYGKNMRKTKCCNNFQANLANIWTQLQPCNNRNITLLIYDSEIFSYLLSITRIKLKRHVFVISEPDVMYSTLTAVSYNS